MMKLSLEKEARKRSGQALCAFMAVMLLMSMLPLFPAKAAQAAEADDLLALFSEHLEYYLPFDGNSESVTQAATTENGVTYEQGKFGQAARFDARTDYVRLDDRAQYPADYSFTVAFWIRDSGMSDPSIFGNKNWTSGANPGFVFSARDGDVRFNANTAGRSRVDYNTNRSLRDNAWHHFVGVINRQTGTLEMYIDGALAGQGDISRFAGQAFTALNTMLGNDGTGTYPDGTNNSLIDDFFLFDTALDAETVGNLYGMNNSLPRLYFSDAATVVDEGGSLASTLIRADGAVAGTWTPVQYVSTDTSLFTVNAATGTVTANKTGITGSAYLVATTTWDDGNGFLLPLTASLKITVGFVPVPVNLTLVGASSATVNAPFLVDAHFNSGTVSQSFKSLTVTYGYDPAVLEFVSSYRASGATYVDDPVAGTLTATYSFGGGKTFSGIGALSVAGRIGTFCFQLKESAPTTTASTALEVREVKPVADGLSDAAYAKTATGLEIATSFSSVNDTNGDGLVSIGDLSNSAAAQDAADIAADANFGFYPVKRVVYLGIDGGGNFLTPEGYYTTNNSTYTWAGKPDKYRYELFEGTDGLAATGSYTPNAVAANPTISGQNWTAMFRGYEPADSAEFTITNALAEAQYYPNEASPYSSIFAALREAQPNRTQSTFIEWGPIENGIIDNDTGAYQYRGGSNGPLREATQMIRDGFLLDSSFMFIDTDHYMDGIGHGTGFYNETYYNAAAVEVADIEVLVNAIYNDPDIGDDTVLMIGADHGGNGTSHGGWTLQEKYIMMYARGPIIKTGYTYSGDNGTIGESDSADARQKDWPALFAQAMGVEGDPDWVGTTDNHDIFLTQAEMVSQNREVESINLVEKSNGYTVELSDLRDENVSAISAAHLVFSGDISSTQVKATPGVEIVATSEADGKLTVIVKAAATFAEGALVNIFSDGNVVLENAMLGKLDGREIYPDLTVLDDSSNPIADSGAAALSFTGPATGTENDTLDYTVSLDGVTDMGTVVVEATYEGELEFLEATALYEGLDVVYTSANTSAKTIRVVLSALELPGISLDGADPIVKLSFKATGEGEGTVTLTGATGGAYLFKDGGFDNTADIEIGIPQGAGASVITDIAKYFDPYDFNRDGKVSVADLTYAQAFYMASAETGGTRWAHVVERGMDVSADGVMDVADFILIIDYLYGAGV